jgi:hypothetical protein
MNPAFRVERFRWDGNPGADGDVDHLIFRQRNRRSVWTREERRPGEFLYPRIWFNAFHPDVVYVAGPNGSVPAPLGDYHSSLVLYAWHRGMRAAETARLFCEPVFERLGFFNCWPAAKHALLEEGRAVDFPIADVLSRWERRGCFMYAPNHPALFVMADIARELTRRAELTPALNVPEYFLSDPMLEKAIWPLYPGIADRLGLLGTYHFKPEQPRGALPMLLDLDEFIDRSFQAYESMSPESLACTRLQSTAYRDLEQVAAAVRKIGVERAPAATRAASEAARAGSPYAGLPAFHYWRRAVEQVPQDDVDPVSPPPFRIDRSTRIATLGSCFAQNMSSVLEQRGYTFFVAESPPPELSIHAARRANYGVFSTRSGNVYTARQLLQLFDRAYGTFVPVECAWRRPDGRYADPFRALVEPEGFATVDELLESREQHLAAARIMFQQLDVLIFTLGLTEAWRSTIDGAVFSAAPGSVAGQMDNARYEFVNFTAADVRADLDAFLARLRSVNAGASVVLTVSPQPPIATYEARHVLVSATYTKAALRVAADAIDRAHANVWYFPGYELVAGGFNRGRYYGRDLRTVTPEGVQHVMRLFLAHCANDADVSAQAHMLAENLREIDVVCDEEEATNSADVPAADPTGERAPSGAQWDDYAVYLGREIPNTGENRMMPEPRHGRMERLDPTSMRTMIGAEIMTSIAARTVVTVPCTVTNCGDAVLATAEPNPVFLSYRWYDEAGSLTEVGHSIHMQLSPALEPGAVARIPMRIEAPRHGGRYVLRISLLQSNVAWFDDVDRRNGAEAAVDVSYQLSASETTFSTSRSTT